VLALCSPVTLVHVLIGEQEVAQVYDIQPHHLLLCDALGLDHAWYEAPSENSISSVRSLMWN
jgi:hypothetical protein